MSQPDDPTTNMSAHGHDDLPERVKDMLANDTIDLTAVQRRLLEDTVQSMTERDALRTTVLDAIKDSRGFDRLMEMVGPDHAEAYACVVGMGWRVADAMGGQGGPAPVLVSTAVSYCVTHSVTDHGDGRAWAGCRFRQLFYFENPADEHTLRWSDAPERPCGACMGRGCDVCGKECSGVAATWCPVHGTCTCGLRPNGEPTFCDSACPLHSSTSDHAGPTDV